MQMAFGADISLCPLLLGFFVCLPESYALPCPVPDTA